MDAVQLNNQNMLLWRGLNVGDRSIDNITHILSIIEETIADPRQSRRVKKSLMATKLHNCSVNSIQTK